MFKLVKWIVMVVAFFQFNITYAQIIKVSNSGLGRSATPAELAAWDIDVRPDFQGLPKGKGSVEQGQEIWENKCSTCHGTFGESNEVFTPIIGGTTPEDIKSGRVASLTDRKQPQRTTIMKVATLSSLWDYIYRAMPWNAPRSLSVNDTYAVLSYLLNLAEIVPDDFELNNDNIVATQQRMPNRNGMTLKHGLWSVHGKADVNAKACMQNCIEFLQVGSELPDYARNAHGNIAEQNREYGPFRGVDTTKPPLQTLPKDLLSKGPVIPVKTAKSTEDVLKDNNCFACHGKSNKIVGPAFNDVAQKYKNQENAEKNLVAKIRSGGAGVWGAIPMPPQTSISEETLHKIVQWILAGQS